MKDEFEYGYEMESDRVPENNRIKYETYYNQVLVKEQPFYRKGMSKPEVLKEMEYLNNNLKSFYDGSYMPLWKQDWFK